MKKIPKYIWIIGLLLLVGGGIAVAKRSFIKNWIFELQKEPVPIAVDFVDVEPNETDSTLPDSSDEIESSETDLKDIELNEADEPELTEPEPVAIPDSINLDIPFTSQAPHANWDLPYQEACEEASALMSARYLQGRSIDGKNDADSAILQLVDFGTEELGNPIDTTAAETAHMIEEFYELQTELIYDFTWDDVKTALAQGYPVIVPAAGRQLGNPNFTQPGPPYHMLVIKGYTENIVITNDPGTRNGADYQYTYDTLYNAVHDWNDGNVTEGDKVMIIVKP